MLKIIGLVLMNAIFQPFAFGETCNDIESVNWLVGDWEAANGNVHFVESWRQTSSKTMEGFGQTRSTDKQKTISSETLRLVEMSGEVFYLAKVASNDLPIAFKLTHCPTGTAIFENPAHDFPSKLAYRLVDKHKLIVSVSGAQGSAFEIQFTRTDTP